MFNYRTIKNQLNPIHAQIIEERGQVLRRAGRIDLGNYYFWRNLLLEMGIFLPLVIVIVPRFSKTLLTSNEAKIIVSMFFVLSVAFSISLQR